MYTVTSAVLRFFEKESSSFRVDCPHCLTKSVERYPHPDFAIGWFIVSPVYYPIYRFLRYHLIPWALGGACGVCDKRLPKT